MSRHYTSVNFVRTIEDVLALPHLNLNTAYEPPMSEVFDTESDGKWTFTAEAAGPVIQPKHKAAWWAAKTRGFDFLVADRDD